MNHTIGLVATCTQYCDNRSLKWTLAIIKGISATPQMYDHLNISIQECEEILLTDEWEVLRIVLSEQRSGLNSASTVGAPAPPYCLLLANKRRKL